MFLSSWCSSKSRRSSCSTRGTAWWTSIAVSNWRWTKIIFTSHESLHMSHIIPSVTMSIQIRINSISWSGRISIPPWIRRPTCTKWSEISPGSISWCLTARGIWWWCAISIARGISRGIWWWGWFCSCWRDEIGIVSLLSLL